MYPILYFSASWVESRQLENPEENQATFLEESGMLSLPTFKSWNTVEVDNNQGFCCQFILIDRLAGSAPSQSENTDALIHWFIHPPILLRKFCEPGTILGAADISASKTEKIPHPCGTYILVGR